MKKKAIILLVSLLIMQFSSMYVQAWTDYNIFISRNPQSPVEGDIITITVTLELEYPDKDVYENINEAFLMYSINDNNQPNVICNEVLPNQYNKITFTIGPFNAYDSIRYQAYMDLKNAYDHTGSIHSFVVKEKPYTPPYTPPAGNGSDNMLWPIVGGSVGTVVILSITTILLIFRRKRKNKIKMETTGLIENKKL